MTEVEEGGMVRMNQVELERRDNREEREAVMAILAEEARSRRLQRRSKYRGPGARVWKPRSTTGWSP